MQYWDYLQQTAFQFLVQNKTFHQTINIFLPIKGPISTDQICIKMGCLNRTRWVTRHWTFIILKNPVIFFGPLKFLWKMIHMQTYNFHLPVLKTLTNQNLFFTLSFFYQLSLLLFLVSFIKEGVALGVIGRRLVSYFLYSKGCRRKLPVFLG